MITIEKPSTAFVFYFKVWKKVPSVLALHAENECLFVNPCELQPREKKYYSLFSCFANKCGNSNEKFDVY